MAIAKFLDCWCLALRASGRWLRYAALQNLIPSFPWIATPRPPPWRNPRKGRDQILPSGNLGHHAPPPWAGPPMPTYAGGEKGICSPGHSVKLGPEEQERCSWFWERNETTAKRSCALQEDEHNYHQQPSVITFRISKMLFCR